MLASGTVSRTARPLGSSVAFVELFSGAREHKAAATAVATAKAARVAAAVVANTADIRAYGGPLRGWLVRVGHGEGERGGTRVGLR